jgi:hypothetical protein
MSRPLWDKIADRFRWRDNFTRTEWLKKYHDFAHDQREFLFLSIARFCHINRPIEGYYFEFGCHEANTMRQAWRHTRHLFNWTYVAFDSFEGFPEPSAEDRSEVFQKGRCATSEVEFIRRVTKAGMPRERLLTVPGFYENSLNDFAKFHLPKKAAVIYIDCDLYVSTKTVLDWIVPFFQKGTIIVFDDWQCYSGDPMKGQKRAWSEFTEAHPTLCFEEWISTNEAKAFIYLGSV